MSLCVHQESSLIVFSSSHSGHIFTAICNVAAHLERLFFLLLLLVVEAFRIHLLFLILFSCHKTWPFLRNTTTWVFAAFPTGSKATVATTTVQLLLLAAVECAFVKRVYVYMYIPYSSSIYRGMLFGDSVYGPSSIQQKCHQSVSLREKILNSRNLKVKKKTTTKRALPRWFFLSFRLV